MGKRLNDKEKVFVNEYLIDLDPVRAALEAGYSKTVARSKAFQWVSDSKLNPKPYIRIAIQEEMDARAERTKITADQVLAELAKIGFSNIKDFVKFDPDGVVNIIDSEELTLEQAACIAEISQSEGAQNSNFKFKLYDKPKALEMLGKHLKLFTEKIEHSGKDGGPVGIVLMPAKDEG